MLSSILVYACLGYVAIAFYCHMAYCWQNPHAIELKQFDRKLAAVEAIAPAAEILLLPPAAQSHPWELAIERMPEIEAIAALHQPAAEVEPPIEDAPHAEPDAPIDYQAMSSQQLRKIAAIAASGGDR